MPKLFIPVGIPGCGKSTFAHVVEHTNLRVVSSDGIRQEFVTAGELKAVNDMSRNNEVFAAYHSRIENLLLDGMDVFADATNLQPFARDSLRTIADRSGAETHVLVFTNLSVAVSRNLKRTADRIVPAAAMVKMLEQYEKALVVIPQESYMSITYIEAVT